MLGFYDHETGELVVAGSAEPTPLTKVIVVHELIHALTDQHFAFGAIFDELREVEAYHEASALQSLVEGDATYFQIVYLQSLPVAEQFEAARESLAADMSVLEALPAFIGADLGFPYDTGFRFVERIVTDQGIGGVDQAYELLPTTTEQIIRPEAYFTLEPALGVDLSGVDLPAWELELEGELGQWNVQNYLLQGVDGGARVIAGDGWGGDWYKLYRAGENTAFAYRFEGDTPRDAQELFDALVVSLGETMDVRAPQISEPGADDDPAVVPSTAIFRGGSYLTIERLGRTVVLAASTDETAHSILADQLSLD